MREFEYMAEIQNNLTIAQRGGARAGAGRPKLTSAERMRWYAARGVNPLTAAEILAQLGGELPYFKRALTSVDDRVMLDALKFLVQMRDGKPAQSISVTSTNLNVNARDVETARAIVRELRDATTPQLQSRLELTSASVDSPLVADVPQPSPDNPSALSAEECEAFALDSQRKKSEPMLQADEGGEKGG